VPWRHCDVMIVDDAPCPTCGIQKAVWTTQWNVTRTFLLSKKATAGPSVKLSLVDPAGEPVPDEPFEVHLPDGQVVAGTLNKYGYAKVAVAEPAAVDVVLPRRAAAELVAGASGPARFTVETDVKHTFQLLALELVVTPVAPGTCRAELEGCAVVTFPTVDDAAVVIGVRVPRLPPAREASEAPQLEPLPPHERDPEDALTPAVHFPPRAYNPAVRVAAAGQWAGIDAPTGGLHHA
jgi:hypothetical protein